MKKPNWFARTAKAAILALSAAVTGAAWADSESMPKASVVVKDARGLAEMMAGGGEVTEEAVAAVSKLMSNIGAPVSTFSISIRATKDESGTVSLNTPSYTTSTDSAFVFTPVEDQTDEYGSWRCDFVVSFDEDVKADSVILAGYYNNMLVPILLGFDFEGNNVTKQFLLDSTPFQFDYNAIVHTVGAFVCTAINIAPENVGKTINVSLVMWNDSDSTYTKSNPYVVTTIPYKFTKENLSTIKLDMSEPMGVVPFHLVSSGKNDALGFAFNGSTLEPREAAPHFVPAYTTTIDEPKQDGTVTAAVQIETQNQGETEESSVMTVATAVVSVDPVSTKSESAEKAIDVTTMVNVESVVRSAAAAGGLEIKAEANTIVIKVQSNQETSASTENKLVYDVNPVAIVNGNTGTPVTLTNDDLADGAEFTFHLDVTSLSGVAEGSTVAATHKSSDGSTVYGTALYTAKAGDNNTLYVEITTDKFSTWDLSAVDIDGKVAAVVSSTGVVAYAELQDAFNAAFDGDTVLLIADCSMTAYIEVNKNITLDLNGQTLAGGYNMFYVTSGKLTIQDTSEGASGEYTSSAGNGDYSTAPSGYKGAVTLRGGSFELKSGKVNGSSYAVRTAKGSGTITVSGSGKLTGMYPIYDGQGTYEIEVTGGKLTTSFPTGSAIHKTTAGSVTISGGEIEALGNSTINTSCVKCGQYGSGPASLTITGGTFNAPYGCLVEMGTGTLTVTDINVTKVGWAPFYNCDKINTASRVSAGDYTSAGYRPTLKAGTLDGGSFRKQDAAYIIDYLVDGYEAYVDTYADVLPEARADFDALADYNGKAFFLRDADVTEFFTNRDPYNNPHQTVTIYRDANFNLSRIYSRLGDTMTVRVADNATYVGNVTFEGEPYHPEMYLDVTGPTSENGFTTTTYTLKEHPFVTLYTDGNRESEGVSYGTVKSAINTIATGNTDALIVAEEGIAYLSAVVDGSNRSFTYDLNGQQITGSAYNIFLNPRGNGSVVNVIDSVGTAHVKSTYNFTSTGLIGDNYKIGTLNVHGGEYTANIVISIGKSYSPVFNIDGGTYNGKVNMANGTLHISGKSIFNGVFTLNNTAVVNITGGYFNEAAYYSLKDSANVTLPEGKALVKATGEYADYYTVGIAPAYVAQIGETGVKYENLMEAIEAAYNGGTVELLADVTVNRWHQNVWSVEDRDDLTYSGNRAVEGCNGLTINGNGHSLTINSIDSGNNGNHIFRGSRNLTVSNITINAASGVNGIGLKSGLISDVTFNMVGSNPAIYTSGSAGCEEGEHIEIRNCTFNTEVADSFAIYSCDPGNGVDIGTVISGNTFNTRRSVALRSDMQFLNNTVNGDKGVTVAEGSTAVIRGNYFAETTTSRSINVYPSNATIENNVILGPIELEDNKTYATAPDLSGNYWGGDYPANLPEGVVVNSYYSTYSGYDSPAQDGSLFSLSDPVVYVAQIGTTKYETLAEAIAAVPTDGTETTIQMIADEKLTRYVVFPEGTDIVLDLNGKTITNADTMKQTDLTTKNYNGNSGIPARFAMVVEGNLEIADNTEAKLGRIDFPTKIDDTTKAIVVDKNGSVTMTGGTVNGQYAAFYVVGNTSSGDETIYTPRLAVNGGSVSGGSAGIVVKGLVAEVSVADGTVYGGSSAVAFNGTTDWYDAGHSKLIITGGTFTSGGNSDSTIYLPAATGETWITGGTITGVLPIGVKGGVVHIGGDAVIHATGQKKSPGAADSGITQTGDAVYIEDTYSYGNNFSYKPTVEITGGKLSSENGYALQYYNNYGDKTVCKDGTTTLELGGFAVSGGVFSSEVSANYCAEGCEPADNTDAETKAAYPYTVNKYVAQNVQTDEKYSTLAAALAAAQDGQTVKLLADAAQNDGIIFDKAGAGVILDLDGKTFTVNTGANCNNRAFRIDNGTLTVKNGSIVAAGSGTTSSNGTGCYGAFRVEKDGTLNVQDATLSNSRPWGLNVKICGGRANLERVTINSSYGGGIEVTEADLGASSQPGYAELTDCTFTQTGYFDHCSTALSVSGGSELVVNSGTYTSENYGLYVFSSGGRIVVKDGMFEGAGKAVVKAEMDTNTYPAYTGAVQISGGKFKGALSVISPASMSISGGVFNVEVPATACASGYEPADNTDAKTKEAYPYTVGKQLAVVDAATGKAEMSKALDGYKFKMAVSQNGGVAAVSEVLEPVIPAEKLPASGQYATYSFTAVKTADGSETETAVQNTVGILRVDDSKVKSETTVIAVPWQAFGDKITIGSLVYLGNREAGDQLMAYDAANGTYYSWTLEVEGSAKTWKPDTTVKTGSEKADEARAASEFEISRGQGVFLKRTKVNEPIYLVGRAPNDGETVAAPTTLAAGSASKPTWSLVAAPSKTALDLNASGSRFGAENADDTIMLVSAGGVAMKIPYTYKNGQWGRPVSKTVTETRANGKTVTYTYTERSTDGCTIPAGTGFWYLNKGDEKTVEW